MASKMISVKEEIYHKLSQLKHENESFSDLFERLLLSRKKNPLKIFQISSKIPEEYEDLFEKTINESKQLRKVTRLKKMETYEEEK